MPEVLDGQNSICNATEDTEHPMLDRQRATHRCSDTPSKRQESTSPCQARSDFAFPDSSASVSPETPPIFCRESFSLPVDGPSAPTAPTANRSGYRLPAPAHPRHHITPPVPSATPPNRMTNAAACNSARDDVAWPPASASNMEKPAIDLAAAGTRGSTGYGGSYVRGHSSLRLTRPPDPASGRIAKKKNSKSGKAPTRGSGFLSVETDTMLDLIEKMQPLCRDEWDLLAQEHGKRHPEKQRTSDSRKKKFATLYRKKIPTGDPRMTEDVRRAKNLRYQLTELAEIGDGEQPREVVDQFLPGVEENSASLASGDEQDAQSTGRDSLSAAPSRGTTPTLRPIINRRPPRMVRDDEDLTSVVKMMTMQDQHRRKEEACLREEERKEDRLRREKERRKEEDRRREDSERHKQFMEMMLVMVTKCVNDNSNPASSR